MGAFQRVEPTYKYTDFSIWSEQMAEFFERSCDAMVVAIKAQIVGNASTVIMNLEAPSQFWHWSFP